MDQNWHICKNMVGQQPRKFSVTRVYHEWKYCKKFFFAWVTFLTRTVYAVEVAAFLLLCMYLVCYVLLQKQWWWKHCGQT